LDARGEGEFTPALEERLTFLTSSFREDEARAVAFVEHLGTSSKSQASALEALEKLHVDDLRLAWLCLEGDDTALDSVAKLVLRVPVGKRDAISADTIAEARQQHLERLLLGDDPKLRQYDGRGPLANWIQVGLARSCIHLHKRASLEVPLVEELLALPASGDDADLALFKEKFRTTYKESFEAAVARLDAPARAVLRQHLVLTMSIDTIARIHGVHRSSAARWLASAKETLSSYLRDELVKRCNMHGQELDRTVLLVESRLDISVHRIFRTASARDRGKRAPRVAPPTP